MTTNIMIDLETLGVGHAPVILSIGAVEFTPGQPDIGRVFSMNVDPEDAQRCGLNVEASTVMWWMQQDDEARAAFEEEAVPLISMLRGFAYWFPSDALLWAKPSTFDVRVLQEAYAITGITVPWDRRNDRDMRTYMGMFPPLDPKPKREGTKHNALDDAIHQVRCMAAASYPQPKDTDQ